MRLFTKKHLSWLSVVVLFVTTVSFVGLPSEIKADDKLSWEVLLQKATGGPDTPQLIVAKEPEIVAEFFDKLNEDRTPNLAVPKVDYAKEMLLILCLGEKTTGGYQIGIAGIEESSTRVTVTVTEVAPEPGAMVTQALTQPFYIAKLKTTNKRIVFKKK